MSSAHFGHFIPTYPTPSSAQSAPYSYSMRRPPLCRPQTDGLPLWRKRAGIRQPARQATRPPSCRQRKSRMSRSPVAQSPSVGLSPVSPLSLRRPLRWRLLLACRNGTSPNPPMNRRGRCRRRLVGRPRPRHGVALYLTIGITRPGPRCRAWELASFSLPRAAPCGTLAGSDVPTDPRRRQRP
jgi:hypothetical protein